MSLDIQIHNNLFMATFKDEQAVSDFLNAVLDKPKLALLDLREIKIQDKSFVNDELRESVADLVVDVKMKGSDDSAHVCFLFEHKSYPEKQIHRQLLRYIANIHEEDYKNGGLPRPVVPIVFYHGEEPWNMPSRYSDFLQYSDEYKKQCLDFEYILFDVKNFDKKMDVEKFNNNYKILLTLAAYKDAKNMEIEEFYELVVTMKKKGLGKDIRHTSYVITYISYVNKRIDKKRSQTIVKDVFDYQEVEKMKSFFGDEYFKGVEEGEARGEIRGEARGREEGREEGRAEGEAKGRTKGMIEKAIEMAKNALRKQLDPEMVAEISGLSLAQVLELQKEL